MTIPTITALPTAPVRSDSTTFESRADALMTALPTLVTEVNAATAALTADANAAVAAADADAIAAAASAAAALASQLAAAASSVATVWVSGTTYAVGDVRYSPTDFLAYRRKTSGGGTTDPASDGTNWALLSGLPSQTSNSGRFLTTNGTSPSWGTPTAPALVLLATLTPTAAANVDFLTTFSSTYDAYLIVGVGINSNSGTSDSLAMRLAVAGSADTGSNYARSSSNATTFTSTTSGLLICSPVLGAGKGADFEAKVLNANDATNLKSIHSWGSSQVDATPGWNTLRSGGVYFAANAVSGIRLYWNSGSNFLAQGSVRVYGITNA